MKMRMPRFPSINWKLMIMVMLIVGVVAGAVRYIPRILSGGDKQVDFVAIEEDEIPDKIVQILPRYKMLERALAAKVEDQVYVIVTRGEKLTGGYSVDIDKLVLEKEGDELKLVVYAVFTDPKPEQLVPQIPSYPFIIVKTNMEELPKKIDLQAAYK
jgi:hypothetical protein